MGNNYNNNPISLREGKVYIDGIECYDDVKCDLKFTPEVWSGALLGQKTPDTRWLGYKITGNITRRRATPWLAEIIEKYCKTGKTPEMTIQGIMDDAGSDYYDRYGAITKTAVGCVITGDISLISMDRSGDVLEDNIAFNAKDVV